jgi:hypothetical protein
MIIWIKSSVKHKLSLIPLEYLAKNVACKMLFFFSCVYFACQGLPYGKEDLMLLIDNEPNKALWNSKCSGLFIETFKGHKLLRNKVQLLGLASCLWSTLSDLPSVRIIGFHYKTFSDLFDSFYQIILRSWNLWKMIMGDVGIIQLLLGMNYLPYYLKIIHSMGFYGSLLNYLYLSHSIVEFCLQLVWITVYRPCNDVLQSNFNFKMVPMHLPI